MDRKQEKAEESSSEPGTPPVALSFDLDSENLIRQVLESTTDGVFMLDREWRFTYLNSRAQGLIGDGKSLIGIKVWDEFPAAHHLPFWDHYHRTMNERVPTEFVSTYPEPLNAWFEVHSYPTLQGISVFFRDITTRRLEEERLHLLEQALASSPMGITIATFQPGGDCPIIYVNPAFERLTGYTRDEVVGLDCRFLQGTDLQQDGRHELQAGIEENRPSIAILRNYKKDGSSFFNEIHLSQVYDGEGRVSHLVGVQHDVSEQLETKAKLARQAEYDSLTGLANRYLLLQRMEQALTVAKQTNTGLAIVVIDLDNFKHLNDRLGHVEADSLLIQVARRLRAAVRSEDTVARLGGDEFALVLTGWVDQGRLHKQMEKALQEIRRPVQVGTEELIVTGSAGVAIYSQDATDIDSLLRMADLSMYWVKRCGKNSFRFYGPELRSKKEESFDLAVGLNTALANREFTLHYQPRVEAGTSKLTGVEALIRWEHPTRGLLSPAQFIRVAEDTGLINVIGEWALERATTQLAAWHAEGMTSMVMSVNVSPAQIRNPEFPALVEKILQKAGLPPQSLELELTESSLIEDADLADTSFRALKKLGVRVAIDDFGAGCANLRYLSRFPVDTIKIDHLFTSNIVSDKIAATICRSVLQLGRDLELRTVAEGVETEAQADLLRTWGCSELQGFLFGKPLASTQAREHFDKLL